MKKQQGFTLIELIMVIVILGILAATALPKFVDFKQEAAQAAVDGVAGAVSSASSINYATCMARGVTGAGCTQLNAASAAAALVAGAMPGGLPSGHSITTEGTCAAQPAGTPVTITITGKENKTANATVVCTG